MRTRTGAKVIGSDAMYTSDTFCAKLVRATSMLVVPKCRKKIVSFIGASVVKRCVAERSVRTNQRSANNDYRRTLCQNG